MPRTVFDMKIKRGRERKTGGREGERETENGRESYGDREREGKGLT